MKVKKWISLCLSVCLLCCSCADKTDTNVPVTPDTATSAEQETPDDNHEARLLYYEQLVGELQSEILTMKAELFAAKSEYDKRIAELEAQTNAADMLNSFTYTVGADGGLTVTGYTGKAINVQIPTAIGGKQVTAIGDRAFADNLTLQSVTVPEGVKEVGWFAFSGCIALGSVTMPASVESISYGAFENCPKTLTVQCPKGSYAQQYAVSYGINASN